MPEPGLDPGSFRDRDGRVFYHDGRVCRALSAEALSAWQRLSDTRFFPELMESGAVVETRRADDEQELLAALGQTDGASWVGPSSTSGYRLFPNPTSGASACCATRR